MTHPKEPAVGSETPLTDAHLVHLNTFDGRKIGIPDSTLDLCRTLELALRRRDTLLRKWYASATQNDVPDLTDLIKETERALAGD